MGFIRFLPYVVEVALVVFCLIDCVQTDSLLVRNLSKPMWILLIVFLPIAGGVAWLVAGRPTREASARRPVPWPSTATAGFPEYERPRPPRGPDDDPAFLSDLAVDNARERRLQQWEAELREREARAAGGAADAVGAAEGTAEGEEPEREARA